MEKNSIFLLQITSIVCIMSLISATVIEVPPQYLILVTVGFVVLMTIYYRESIFFAIFFMWVGQEL